MAKVTGDDGEVNWTHGQNRDEDQYPVPIAMTGPVL